MLGNVYSPLIISYVPENNHVGYITSKIIYSILLLTLYIHVIVGKAIAGIA